MIQSLILKMLFAAIVTALPTIVLAQDGQAGQDGPRQGGAAFAGGQMIRGTVTAATADHLTVKTETGDVYQVSLSANTRLTKDRQPVKATDIKVGDGVGAMGVLDAPTKTVHAVFVGVIDAEQVKKARENMGKTYITGKVTAIDMDTLKVTIMRPDGVSQVIRWMNRHRSKRADAEWRRWQVGRRWRWATERLVADEEMVVEMALAVVQEMAEERVLRSRM